MQILLVEDDPKLAGFIRKGFLGEQINLEIAYDGLMGKRLCEQRIFDAIILDVNLPGIDGFDLCRLIKSSRPQTPVMMLTALGVLQDKVLGMKAGADDYLTKPFEFEELLMRIKSLALKNNNLPSQSKVLKVGDLVLDTDSQHVRRDNIAIELTKREYELLEYLMYNKGKIVGRTDILERVWNLHSDTNTNIFDVYINYLRGKIDKNFTEKLLHTITGKGYTLREP